jgi:glycosyltransferase involved in cell wall biosynthesis
VTFQQFLLEYQNAEVIEYPHKVSAQPLVSVCVQTYQHANFISDCLEGILKQETDFPFEILLGEDSSTDGTREICLDYASRYPDRIRLFLHDRKNNIMINNRPSSRFNFLYNLYNSRGEYIAICEGDDYWTDPLKLKKQIRIIKSIDCVATFSNALVVDQEDAFLKKFHNGRKSGIVDKRDVILNGGSIFPTATLLFRKEAIQLDKFIRYMKIPGGDTLLIYLLLFHGSIYYMEEILCCYRVWSGGLYGSIREKTSEVIKNKITELTILKQILEDSEHRRFRKFIRRKISLNSLYILRKSSSISDKLVAARSILPVDLLKLALNR